MSAQRAVTVRERPRRQRNSRPNLQPAESFPPRHGVAIALETVPVLPVPMLAWPADLFADVHPMADDDWIAGELSMNAPGCAPRHDHAGAAS